MALSNDSEQTIQVISSKKGGLLYKSLGKHPLMVSICQTCDKYYLLSSSLQLFSLQVSSFSKISLPAKVLKISCNKETLLILSDVGVYYIGYDLVSTNFAYSAKAVEGLEQVKFIEASLGNAHAAGIDDLGNLYIWGPAYGPPKLVESAKAFSSSKVACIDSLTSICTSGGYFYIYGWFGQPDISLIPYTLPELEKHFIIDICASQNFCGILTEDGIVLGLDERKDIIRMPGSNDIQKIFPIQNGILSYNPTFLYKWYGSSMREWQLEVFRSSKKYTILGCGNSGLVIQGDCDLEYIKTLDPYRISYEAHQSFTKSRENPFSLSNQSPLVSLNSTTVNTMTSPKSLNSTGKFSLYSTLFPGEDTFNKLLSYRKQHLQAGFIVQVLRPIVLPYVIHSWDKIKKAAKAKVLLSKTMLFTFLPSVSERLLQKQCLLRVNFAWAKIVDFVKIQKIKEAESNWVLNNNWRLRVEKFEGIIRKLMMKEKNRYGKKLVKNIKKVIEKEHLKIKTLNGMLKMLKKIELGYISQSKTKWVLTCKKLSSWEKGLRVLHRITTKKLGTYSFKHLKAYHYIQALKQNKLKSSFKLILHKIQTNHILPYFTSWCKLLYISYANKAKSTKIYTSLCKHIFAVVSHKYKSNMKFAYEKIQTTTVNYKLIKLYKNPLLYFTTVMSKILCRLKFSGFSTIHRIKDKPGFVMNLCYSDKLSGLWFVMIQLWKKTVIMAWEGIKDARNDELSISCSGTLEDLQDQTMRIFQNIDTEGENMFAASQLVPKLPLRMVKGKNKPPVTVRSGAGDLKKVPWKAPNRSGSYGAGHSREDSLSRRKNYDDQLRRKIRNNDKYMKKPDLPRPNLTIIPNRKKTKYIETKNTGRDYKDFMSDNDIFFKYSLGLLTIRRLWEKVNFAFTMSSFKILKNCYKYSRDPYHRCIRCSPEKS